MYYLSENITEIAIVKLLTVIAHVSSWTVQKLDLEIRDNQWTFYLNPNAPEDMKPTVNPALQEPSDNQHLECDTLPNEKDTSDKIPNEKDMSQNTSNLSSLQEEKLLYIDNVYKK